MAKEKFLSYMPAGCQGMDVETRQVDKVNRGMDGLALHGPGRAVSPAMYVNGMCRDFLDTGDLRGTVRNAAEAMDGAFRQAGQKIANTFRAFADKPEKECGEKRFSNPDASIAAFDFCRSL